MSRRMRAISAASWSARPCQASRSERDAPNWEADRIPWSWRPRLRSRSASACSSRATASRSPASAAWSLSSRSAVRRRTRTWPLRTAWPSRASQRPRPGRRPRWPPAPWCEPPPFPAARPSAGRRARAPPRRRRRPGAAGPGRRPPGHTRPQRGQDNATRASEPPISLEVEANDHQPGRAAAAEPPGDGSPGARTREIRGASMEVSPFRGPPARTPRHGARPHRHHRGAPAQPPERHRRDPQEEARGLHRGLGLGQVLPGLRHPLRRGAAPLHREPERLRPPVPRADGQAPLRLDQGAGAHHLHRAEDRQHQPPLHGGHHHRDPRLPAGAVGAGGTAELPQLRAAGLPAVRPADRPARSWTCRRGRSSWCSPPW